MILEEDVDEAVADEEAADEEPEAAEESAEPEEPKCEGCDGRTFVEGIDPNTGQPSPRAQSVTCPDCGGSGKPKIRPGPAESVTAIESERNPDPPEEELDEEELDPQVPPEEGAAVASQPTELAEAEGEAEKPAE